MQDDLLSHDEARALRDAIVALDGVADMHGGRFGEVASLFPGEKVNGIHVASPRGEGDTARLEINVTADAASKPRLDDLAAEIRRIAATFVTIPIDVTIGDVA